MGKKISGKNQPIFYLVPSMLIFAVFCFIHSSRLFTLVCIKQIKWVRQSFLWAWKTIKLFSVPRLSITA